jgi:hypothetical protein
MGVGGKEVVSRDNFFFVYLIDAVGLGKTACPVFVNYLDPLCLESTEN